MRPGVDCGLVFSLTFVLRLRQSEHRVVDQRKLLVLTDQIPVNKGPVITVVLHKHLTALLTERQRDRQTDGFLSGSEVTDSH